MAVTNQGPSGSTPKFTKPNGGLGFPEETKKPLKQIHPVNDFPGTSLLMPSPLIGLGPSGSGKPVSSKLGSESVMGLVNKKQPQVANFTGEKEYIIKSKYKLLNYCKGGAFGDVFFAKHIEKGYDVAIKFVSAIPMIIALGIVRLQKLGSHEVV
jgi:hypothetical protein